MAVKIFVTWFSFLQCAKDFKALFDRYRSLNRVGSIFVRILTKHSDKSNPTYMFLIECATSEPGSQAKELPFLIFPSALLFFNPQNSPDRNG